MSNNWLTASTHEFQTNPRGVEAAKPAERGHIDNPSEIEEETIVQDDVDNEEKPTKENGVEDPFQITGSESSNDRPQKPDQIETPPEEPSDQPWNSSHTDTGNSTEQQTEQQRDAETDTDPEDSSSLLGKLHPSRGPSAKSEDRPHDRREATSNSDKEPEPDKNTAQDSPSQQESKVDSLLGEETVQWLIKTLPPVILMLLIGSGLIYYFT
jgi:hypothetical protein